MQLMPRCLTRAQSEELARLAQADIGRMSVNSGSL
jgi:hypothetical protein